MRINHFCDFFDFFYFIFWVSGILLFWDALVNFWKKIKECGYSQIKVDIRRYKLPSFKSVFLNLYDLIKWEANIFSFPPWINRWVKKNLIRLYQFHNLFWTNLWRKTWKINSNFIHYSSIIWCKTYIVIFLKASSFYDHFCQRKRITKIDQIWEWMLLKPDYYGVLVIVTAWLNCINWYSRFRKLWSNIVNNIVMTIIGHQYTLILMW